MCFLNSSNSNNLAIFCSHGEKQDTYLFPYFDIFYIIGNRMRTNDYRVEQNAHNSRVSLYVANILIIVSNFRIIK